MASKKDKLLENAQRLVLKGQIDKAIREYQQIVALDPREIRFRQRLAELLVRDNRKEEAIAEYEGIGKHYAENSYFLKAIAVYKQIQRLDPANPEISLTLASLNQKQGLTGNAHAEYAHTVGLLERQGNLQRALKVVGEMLAMDGENMATLLKHAELQYATGAKEAAFGAFRDLYRKVAAGPDDAAADRIAGRISELFPGRLEVQADLSPQRSRESAGAPDIGSLRQAVAADERNPLSWRLYCDALRGAGQMAELDGVLKRMGELFPRDVAVLSQMMRHTLDCGRFEELAGLLKRHRELFSNGGAGQQWDELYRMLPAEMQGEPQWQDSGKVGAKEPGEGAPPGGGAPSGEDFVPLAAPPLPTVGWEEEIQLDFDDDSPQGAELPLQLSDEPEAPAAPIVTAAADEMEMDWPQESGPLAEPEPVAEGPVGPLVLELDDLPWGELSPEEDATAPVAETDGEPQPFPGAEPAVEPDPFPAGESGGAPDLPVTETGDEMQSFPVPEAGAEPEPFPVPEAGAEPEPFPFDLAPPTLELVYEESGEPEQPAPEEAEEFSWDDAEGPNLESAEGGGPYDEPADQGHSLDETGSRESLEPVDQEQLVPPSAQPQETGGSWSDVFPGCLEAELVLDLEEAESHYDLGIAYLEMGRYDLALKEFAVAAANPRRRLDCLILQALAHHEKGDAATAEALLEKGLGVAHLEEADLLTLRYELAALHEKNGSMERCIALYREVFAAAPNFRDVAQKLAALAGEEPLDIIDLELEEGL